MKLPMKPNPMERVFDICPSCEAHSLVEKTEIEANKCNSCSYNDWLSEPEATDD